MYVTTPREGSSKCGPPFPCFSKMHRCCPSRPHVSQDSVRARKRRRKERKRRHRAAYIVTFAGLSGRNRDARVKHLVTQPGNAPKVRPSHLKTADVVNKISLRDSPSTDADPEARRSDRIAS